GVGSEEYFIDSEIVFAYFKTYDVSSNTSYLFANSMVSYVFILNVSNPNNETFLFDDLLVSFNDFAVKDGNSVSGTTELIRYCNSFGSSDLDYQLPSGSSRLMVFTGTGELSNLELMGLKNDTTFSTMILNGHIGEDVHVGSGLIFTEMSFCMISETELMYNVVLHEDQSFSFRNDSPNVSYE
ncbi:MAG: hypothetical protein JW702_04970, partial [Clostridiales bacterium]|nr:hypothetical protein [Clostridiales bacterium]